MINSRLAAKALYVFAALLQNVKRPQQTYAVSWPSPEDERRTRIPQGRRWMPINLANRAAQWSQRCDPQHWRHWALDHSHETAATRCDVCGGLVCTDLAA